MKKLLAVLALVLIPAVAAAQIVVDHSTGTVSTIGVTADAATIDTLSVSGFSRLFNTTPPTASPTDGIVLFASDDAGSSKFWLRDEAGNQEQVLRGTVDGTEIRLGSDAQGDIMYYSGTDWVRLTAGASGQTLVTAGGSANPRWAVAGDGPMFSVTSSQDGIPQNVFTKIPWNSETFDTNDDFDSTTNYRFTPTVAGKYILSATVTFNDAADQQRYSTAIYKNGSIQKTNFYRASGTAAQGPGTITGIFDANGTTDFFEIFAFQTDAATRDTAPAASDTWWMGMRIGS